jgi:hypothetical protein
MEDGIPTDPEDVRDIIGSTVVGTGLVSVTVDDASDTVTVATSATQNSTDASLRDRATHTGTQTASTISDLTERVQDEIGAALVAGTNATVSYNDSTGKTTIGSTGISQSTADATYLPKSVSGNTMAGVFVVANGATAPATLPDGTVIVELDA